MMFLLSLSLSSYLINRVLIKVTVKHVKEKGHSVGKPLNASHIPTGSRTVQYVHLTPSIHLFRALPCHSSPIQTIFRPLSPCLPSLEPLCIPITCRPIQLPRAGTKHQERPTGEPANAHLPALMDRRPRLTARSATPTGSPTMKWWGSAARIETDLETRWRKQFPKSWIGSARKWRKNLKVF